jgi:acetolactate synthase-1/2/3 large subunit
MGWALPASTGAYIASKKRILCFTGDGSFLTGSSELDVLREQKADVIVFIFNNKGYVSIRNTQDTFFEGRHVGTNGSVGVDLSRLCAAHSIKHKRIYDSKELDEELDQVLAFVREEGPVVIEIMTNIEQEIIPTILSITDEDGKIISGVLDRMYPFEEYK